MGTSVGTGVNGEKNGGRVMVRSFSGIGAPDNREGAKVGSTGLRVSRIGCKVGSNIVGLTLGTSLKVGDSDTSVSGVGNDVGAPVNLEGALVPGTNVSTGPTEGAPVGIEVHGDPFVGP